MYKVGEQVGSRENKLGLGINMRRGKVGSRRESQREKLEETAREKF